MPFRIVANRIEEVALTVFSGDDAPVSTDLPIKQLQALIRYVIASCPNLKKLRIE